MNNKIRAVAQRMAPRQTASGWCLGAAGAAALALALMLGLPPQAAWAQAPGSAPAAKPGTGARAVRPARTAASAPAAANPRATGPTEVSRPGFNFSIAPVPAWVVPAPPPAGAATAAAPMHYRVIDVQMRVEGSSASEYTRVLRVVDEAAGLPVASQIELEFDPAYQQLVLHRLDVLRQGQRMDRLDRQRVELLQREKQLEQRMLDGRVTANVVVDDLRVGDEIDLAYSIVGTNPVFGGKFVNLAWMSSHRGPVALYQVRLLAPAGRNIRHLQGPADVTVEKKAGAQWNETVFSRRAVPVLRFEPGAPASALLSEQLQFSEFADWPEVAAWGEALFRDAAASPHAQARADEIRAGRTAPEEQVREALRFVQQEVRYFGVEVGVSSHRPAAPDQVLERRFGDCKDKVGLLAALLNRLQVPVRPVLVSLRLRDQVAQMLPSPLAFDHVIARVDLPGQAQPLWLDATRAHQSGSLGARGSLGLGQGLELAAASPSLTALPAVYDSERMRVDDTIRVQRFDQAPVLESRVTWRGDLAEGVRELVATQGLQALAEGVNSSYVRAYPKLRRNGTPRVEPVEGEDAVSMVQTFDLGEFWRFPEQRALAAEVVLWAAAEPLVPPKSETRRLPLQFNFPGVYRHRVRVEFAEDVYAQGASRRNDDGDAHFKLTTQADSGRNFVEHQAELRIGVEQVAPKAWAGFTAAANKALPRLGVVVAVSAVPMARAEGLNNELKVLEDGLRSKRVKAVTSTQVQSQFKTKVLTAQLDGGRLSAPLRVQALLARGVALDHSGQPELGRKDFEDALALEPDNNEVLNALATNAQGRGANDLAVDYATRVLKTQPRDTAALQTRAVAQYMAGRPAEARPDLEAALADRSALRRGYPLVWLALALRRDGQDLSPLLQKYPRDLWPSEWPRPLLDTLVGGSSVDSALQAAKSSKTAAEAQTEAYFYLAEKLAAEGDASRARDYWRRAVDLGVVEFIEHQNARQRLDKAR